MTSRTFARFRVVPSDDPRFPVVPEVSIDGDAWHPIACAALKVRESVDDAAMLDITVHHEFAPRTPARPDRPMEA